MPINPTAPDEIGEKKLTEIKAQSPQYSTNVGRVESKKAGKARSDVVSRTGVDGGGWWHCCWRSSLSSSVAARLDHKLMGTLFPSLLGNNIMNIDNGIIIS
jgi:hypothetical protein